MYAFGNRSKTNLATCRVDLVQVAHAVMDLQIMDFAILCGHRDEEAQTQAFLLGNSKVQWPHSRHNMNPSNALDFAPWIHGGIPWKDTHSFAMLGGIFIAIARKMNTPLRYGGDWNSNGSTEDQILMDWGHIELTVGS